MNIDARDLYQSFIQSIVVLLCFKYLISRGDGAVGWRRVACLNPIDDIRQALKKQAVTATLRNEWQHVSVSRVLENDHYKRVSQITAGVAR